MALFHSLNRGPGVCHKFADLNNCSPDTRLIILHIHILTLIRNVLYLPPLTGVVCRGTPEEKLDMMFSIFDINNDGAISKAEMLAIMRALYKLNDRRCSARLKQVFFF